MILIEHKGIKKSRNCIIIQFRPVTICVSTVAFFEQFDQVLIITC